MGSRTVRIVIIIFFLEVILGCKTSDTDWTVLFPAIPKRITVKDANINIVQYILRQTHEPLFRENEQGVFISNVFSSWTRSADNKNFNFCLTSGLKFDNKMELNVKDVERALREYSSYTSRTLNILVESPCIRILSDVSLPTLFLDLKDYRFAPTRLIKDGWEIGLGPFRVKTLNQDQIVMVRKYSERSAHKFKTITIADPSKLSSWDGTVEDANRSIDELPDWLNLSNYKTYPVNLLQTLIVVLNDSDRKIRTAIFDCSQGADFRTAFNPDLSEFVKIRTLLPLEIYPSKNSTEYACERIEGGKSLYFVNWRSNNSETLSRYLTEVTNRSGIKIEELKMTPTEFVDVLVTKSAAFSKFHLIPIAVDAGDSDISQFFRMFFDEQKKHISYRIPEGERLYKKLLATTDQSESLKIARQLADILNKEKVVIPMYQVRKNFLYPDYIKNLNTGRNFLEYPEVANLEI